MAEQDFAGRVALVTGGSGGIGAELCARLAAAGAAIAVHYVGNRDVAERVAAGIGTNYGRAAVLAADLRDPEAPGRLGDEAERALGPVDVLAANAGLSRPASYGEVDATAFDETLAINLRAPYLLARRVLPGHARARVRADPVHVVGRRADRRHRRSALRLVEGGAARAHALPGVPGRARRGDGQRDRPGADRGDRDAAR